MVAVVFVASFAQHVVDVGRLSERVGMLDLPHWLDHAVGPTTPGFTAIGIFLFFGSITASLAATTLLWRGTVLDRLWALNPIAYKQLAIAGALLLFLLQPKIGAAFA
jgi:hypothetical protein